MINQKLRDHILELFPDGETVLLDNPSYDNSIIGLTESGQAVYSYELMVHEMMSDDGCTREDAEDYIQYNTMRSLGYMGALKPVVMTVELDSKEFSKKK